MKSPWIFSTLVTLAIIAPLRAGTLDLDLQKAIRLALAKNFSIRVEEFSPRIAKARQTSVSGKFDPIVSASATYSSSQTELRTLNNNLDVPTAVPGGDTPDLFNNQNGQEFDSSIAGLLPTGMTYDFGPSLTVNTDDRRDFTQYNSFFGLSLSQPLLKNFGTAVNLADVRTARADQSISQWALRAQIIDTITETIFVYCDLHFAIGNLGVERRSRSLSAQLLDDNSKRAEIGVMSPLDVMQARADLASREERVLVAERAVADNENFLKQLVTDQIPEVLSTGVTVTSPTLPDTAAPDVERDFVRVFQLRPDYRQALLDIQKRQINVVFTRNQALPRLDLVGSLGVNGIDKSLASSFERMSGGKNNNLAWDIGAIFSLPVPNREARGNLEISKLEALRSLVSLKRLEQAILVESDNAAGQIETARKRIEATRIAREFAQMTLEAAQARLASGTSTTFEVLQFQRDLATAEVSELRANTDFIKALAEYARRTGTTLDPGRILATKPG